MAINGQRAIDGEGIPPESSVGTYRYLSEIGKVPGVKRVQWLTAATT